MNFRGASFLVFSLLGFSAADASAVFVVSGYDQFSQEGTGRGYDKFILDHGVSRRLEFSLAELPPGGITLNQQHFLRELPQPQAVAFLIAFLVMIVMAVFLTRLATKLNKARLALNRANADLEALAEERTENLALSNRNLEGEIAVRQKAEEDYLMIFREISEGFALHEIIRDETGGPVDYRFLLVNSGFERLTGLKAADIVGKTALEVLPGLERNWIENYGKVALTGESAKFDSFSSPLQKHYAVTAFRPAPDRFACIFTDITEKRRVNRILELPNQALAEVLNGFDALVYVADMKTYEIVFVNAYLKNIFGDVTGKTCWEALQRGQTGPCKFCVNSQLLDRDGKPAGVVVRELQNTVTNRWHEFRGKALYWPDGRLVRMEIATDITDRKQAERARLDSQSRQLQKAESLGRMAGAIAHIFNNQLGVVIGNLELASDGLPADARPGIRLSAAMQAANKAASVSRQMLTYLGQIHSRQESLDLADVCQRSLPVLQAMLPGNVTLTTALPAPGPVISSNAGHLQQILTNLVTNGWEALSGVSPGTIHLSVQKTSLSDIPREHRFPVDWRPRGNSYACLEVADTGCGIPPQDIEKLFDPFFSSKFTGRGLGLPTVLGIVKAHGGVVTVISEAGRGSSFRIFFPVVEEELLEPPAPAETVREFAGGGLVLLIDDEQALRGMAAEMLESFGFSVLEAKDGFEAVELFVQRRNEIRLVLSDLTMPRMNGWETLNALRKLAPDIPVILASGYGKEQVMADDHPETPQAFLEKPYKLKELGDAISQALARGG